MNLPEIRGKYRKNVDLSKSTWFGVGGNAKILFKPEDTQDLSDFLHKRNNNHDIVMLGLCSNVIIRDGGINGVVIKLGRNFTDISLDKDLAVVTAGTATTNYNFIQYLLNHNLQGMEFLVGIPGSIGGAVAMNAGCYESEIRDFIVSVEAVEKSTGKVRKFFKEDLGLKYRYNQLTKEFIFTSACFQLKHCEDINIMKEKIERINASRLLSQPIKEKTGGSTFKNPKSSLYKAWELIDKAEFRGYVHGGAKVSDKHCNFLINQGNASARDLEELGAMIKFKVKKLFNINLDWEIQIFGKQ